MVPKSCDTMVALGRATRNGQTLFAKKWIINSVPKSKIVFAIKAHIIIRLFQDSSIKNLGSAA